MILFLGFLAFQVLDLFMWRILMLPFLHLNLYKKEYGLNIDKSGHFSDQISW